MKNESIKPIDINETKRWVLVTNKRVLSVYANSKDEATCKLGSLPDSEFLFSVFERPLSKEEISVWDGRAAPGA